MIVYGIDVGGTTIKIGRFQDGLLTEKKEIPTDTRDNGRNILPDIAKNLGPADGAGLALPGPVMNEQDLNGCVNLGWWGLRRPGDELCALTGIPTKCLNDANAAALGEQWQGGGQGYEDVLLVTLGTGVGAGFVLDGRLYSGSHGAACELGHLCMDPTETLSCSCGNRGCLEQYASATGFVRLAREAGLNTVSAESLFEKAKAGDETALAVVDRACGILGRGLAMAGCALDPEAIVLGGGVSRAGEFLRWRVEAAFQKHVFHACRGTRILLATLGNDAGIYGAARLAMKG